MPQANTKEDVFTLYDMRGDNPTGCWRWLGAWGGRSRTLRPYYQHGNRRQIAYRCVYECVHGVKLTSDQLIMHSCDNGSSPYGCGNPQHISVGTNTENMAEMKERQRHGLPFHAVRNIRKLLDRGVSHADISELYGCSASTVSAIATGRTHSHVVTDAPTHTEEE